MQDWISLRPMTEAEDVGGQALLLSSDLACRIAGQALSRIALASQQNPASIHLISQDF